MNSFFGKDYWKRLLSTILTIHVALGVGLMLQEVLSNPFALIGGVIMISSALLYVIDGALFQIDQQIKMFMIERQLKKNGFSSISEATTAMNQWTDYLTKIQRLPPEAQLEIQDKAIRTEELIKDYQTRPDFYFKNMGTTKQETIEQTRREFNNWMKQKGYPEWPQNINKS